ncbi:hypothetical protein EN868_11645 [Mesorhizobium sp. M2D.F.Ca.ET.225.01.1.1]|uniref:transcriptional coactivator p15/PC4 family protein n=1 Tax=unclassified Mesorhizobium TaxID=325217 RepID=UPI000FD4AEB0|nr:MULTISPECIES: transcriptional coactivator p15/PC4 family protein [unclassified Mesorhizobium]TGP55769.1 hypothetical protein EN869_025455 [Mesorhizobium sp. M2D.F.Ca.ET.226.01.1.1]TGP68227.1 hypothetical protein EN868_11645 [Mesorhizobium sp. M2D.F.Ca.ET.225.01.1.1]
MNEETIAKIPHGRNEEIRVSVIEKNGKRSLKLRVWFMKDGELRPGSNGMQIRFEAMREIMGAIAALPSSACDARSGDIAASG